MKIHYLLVKQHQESGLRYLCKHTTSNPETCFSYKGSGTYWTRHLKKYGDSITTYILFSSSDTANFRKIAKLCSLKFDVSKSKYWANLCDEEGQGGNTFKAKTKDEIQKIMDKVINSRNVIESNARRKITQESWTEEYKKEIYQKVSKSLTNKPKTEIHKLNLRGQRPHVNQSGSKNNNSKGIFTPEGYFGTLAEAANFFNLSYYKIYKKINNSELGWRWEI